MTNLTFNNLIRPQSLHKHNGKYFFIFIKQEFNIVYLQIVKTRLYPFHSYASSIISISYSC